MQTLDTGVAARNAANWATQALGSCGLLHVFNPLSHAATTGVWLAIMRVAYTRCYTRVNRHCDKKNVSAQAANDQTLRPTTRAVNELTAQ